VEALKAGGIPVVLVEATGNAEQIVTAFQSGALRPASGGMCQCQH
jgi:predicted Fe-Mo cluster-binding NifX family protein